MFDLRLRLWVIIFHEIFSLSTSTPVDQRKTGYVAGSAGPGTRVTRTSLTGGRVSSVQIES